MLLNKIVQNMQANMDFINISTVITIADCKKKISTNNLSIINGVSRTMSC